MTSTPASPDVAPERGQAADERHFRRAGIVFRRHHLLLRHRRIHPGVNVIKLFFFVADNQWPILQKFYDRYDSGLYYKTTIMILIDNRN